MASRDNEGIAVEEAAKCPLCGHAGHPLYSGLRDRYWAAPGAWGFRRCGRCGHMWLDPRPLPGEIGRLYASYYTHGVGWPDPMHGVGFWPRCQRGVLEALGYPGVARDSTERLLGKVSRFLPPLWDEFEQTVRSVPGPPRGTLLDAGSGDGAYMTVMKTLGWDVRGIEPDSNAVRVARGRGLDVLESSIEEGQLPAGHFDVITMSHVIEHVLDPAATFVAVHRALRPGGLAVVLTPNAESWGHSLFGPAWFHLDPPRHLHLFSSRNLVAIAERAGLEVLRVRTTGRGHLMFDGSVSVRRTGRFRFDDPSLQASTSERAFRLAEHVLVRVAPRKGEEIVLSCTKGKGS
jgi:SAM-dependent methyltransferase